MQECSWTDGKPYDKTKRENNNKKLTKESIIPGGFKQKHNKRDLANEKMNMRLMTGQTAMNPFRANNDYITDIDIQAKFLRPKDTNASWPKEN